ncbi:hypothetical protein B0F90DRAFT_1769658 [Multifurca ochricompacta]|uniref:Uncharacterized protein n=1 Tax=Multifurca ochricompacta TaxID=376703 RepID=A0AAD4LW00_9AGAM|nr:hypothetical protein B0F90DRAFT_1769658 [Multifurca ochricompacta]
MESVKRTFRRMSTRECGARFRTSRAESEGTAGGRKGGRVHFELCMESAQVEGGMDKG